MSTKKFVAWLAVLVLCLAAGCKTQFETAPSENAGIGASATGSVPPPGSSPTAGTGGSPWTGGGPAASAGSGGVIGAAGENTDGSIGPAGAGGATVAGSGGMAGGTIPGGGTGGGTGGATVVAGEGGVGGGTVPNGGTGGEPEPVFTCPATSSLAPGETTQSVQAGGRNRTYILHVPASYTGQTPVPLVLDWHGILMNSGIERRTSGWSELSDQEGFIVAFPEGIDTAFNVGICCTTSRDVDDVATGRAIVEQIRQQGCIDPKRIHSVGYSLGGGMSMHLACNATDLFASIATSAFDLIQESDYQCVPSRKIAIIDFRNTGDPICPYNGGPTWPPNGLPVIVTFMGAEATFAWWAQFNECSGSPVSGAGGCPTYNQCAEGVEVTMCTDTNQTAGHGWMDARIAWDFLKRHPMP